MDRQSFTEIKNQFPDQWILLGNPTSEDGKVVSGIVILHSDDKKELFYLGKGKIADFNRITVVFTGNLMASRQLKKWSI